MLVKLAYSPKQASEATGLGRTAIFQALREGRLERRKVGRRTVIPADSLRAFLAGLPSPNAQAQAAQPQRRPAR